MLELDGMLSMSMTDFARRVLTAAPLASVIALSAACGANIVEPSPQEAVFRVRACDTQTFAIRLTDPDLIARAEQLIGQPEQPIVSGALAPGDGGVNAPFDWHLEPSSIEFVDATIELCDGCPRMVEENLQYWLGTVGRFCPWSSAIVARVR